MRLLAHKAPVPTEGPSVVIRKQCDALDYERSPLEALVALLGDAHVDLGDAVSLDAAKDESLHGAGQPPAAVVRPVSAAEVAAVVSFAAQR
ncbi:hypothetical protein ACW5CM_01870 [Microbacterium sp. A588]